MSLIGPQLRSPLLHSSVDERTPASASRAGASDASVQAPGHTWLFAVGVSDYAYEGLEDLHFADDDARAIARFFSESGIVAPEHTTVLIDGQATRRRILDELDRLYGRTAPNDLVIIYLAMHGFSARGDLYVLPYDGQPVDPDDQGAMQRLRATSLSDPELTQMTNKAAARRFVIIADTCHSVVSGQDGARGIVRPKVDPMMARVLQTKPGVSIITASSADQASREHERWGGHGVFTATLLEGLEGAADVGPGEPDGLVTIRELFEYTRRVVGERTAQQQHPALRGSFDDAIPLARVPTSRAPPASPPPREEAPAPQLSEQAHANYLRAQDAFDKHPCQAAAHLRKVEDAHPDWGSTYHDLGLALERCGRFHRSAQAYLHYQRYAQPLEQAQTRARIAEMAARQQKLGMGLWIPSAFTSLFAQVIVVTAVVTSDAPWLFTGLTRQNLIVAAGIGYGLVPGIAIGATYHARGRNLSKQVRPADSSVSSLSLPARPGVRFGLSPGTWRFARGPGRLRRR